jgi:ABC-type lipoprotein release transport system permease subunit
VTAISAVSICGVAVATAAIVCVLSVFNGFRGILTSNLNLLSADITVTPTKGKTITNGDSLAVELGKIRGVDIAMPSLTDNALVICNGREMPITLRGVVAKPFSRITSIDKIMLAGEKLHLSDTLKQGDWWRYDPDLEEYVEVENPKKYYASLAAGCAARIGSPQVGENILVFAPRRIGKINLANPANSFLRDSLTVSSVWQTQQQAYDTDMVIVDIDLARQLFQYDNEATSIEIKATEGTELGTLVKDLNKHLGSGYIVKDRIMQQEVNFHMLEIEKWVTFLLLAFILIIASFNIISTLSMIVLDKRNSLHTFHSMGMNRREIGKVFAWESIFVTIAGAIVGIIVGVTLCLLQQHYGFIKLNGDPTTLIIQSYPVIVKWPDLAMVFLPVCIIGLVTALISSRFAQSRIETSHNSTY